MAGRILAWVPVPESVRIVSSKDTITLLNLRKCGLATLLVIINIHKGKVGKKNPEAHMPLASADKKDSCDNLRS